MSVFFCDKQIEDTMDLLKSRVFLLSFENKKLRDKLSELENAAKHVKSDHVSNQDDQK